MFVIAGICRFVVFLLFGFGFAPSVYEIRVHQLFSVLEPNDWVSYLYWILRFV
jgi:hypothetical protein